MGISSRTRSKLKKKESEEKAEVVSRLVNLPLEIHDEIFLQLPGTSILALRCVCNYFYNLLSNPRFIKNHLNIHSKSNPKLLCFHQSLKNKPPVIYSVPIDYDSISSLSSSYDGAFFINYPFESTKTYDHNILGSCHGLVCLKIDSYDRIENERGEFLQTCYYSILNPLTGEFKEFLGPYGSKYRHPAREVNYGFGYDSNLDDYKLVMISDFEKAGCFKIDVYAMKLDSWNRIQGTLDYSFLYGCERSRSRLGDKRSHGVFFNGSLHWLGFLGSKATRGTSAQVIICFGVTNQTMMDMPLPEDIFIPPKATGFQHDLHMNMGVWGDCICVTCVWGPAITEVWVMQEYGVKESWIRKYTQRRSRRQLLESWLLVPYWQPLWRFHNEEILVNNCCQELLLYDPTNDTVKSVRSVVARDVIMDENRESYVESLVSLDSGTYVEKHIHIR